MYTSSLGGGLVRGDSLRLDIEVGPGATLFVSSQSQTKVFKGASRSEVRAKVAAGGLLVFWPAAVACFRDATYVQDTLIEVEPGGSVLALDAWTSGRPAHETPWTFRGFTSRTRIVGADGVPLLVDGTAVDREDPSATAQFHAFAAVLAAGPRCVAIGSTGAEESRDDVDARQHVSRGALSAQHSLPRDRFVARFGTGTFSELTEHLAGIRRFIVGELGDDPFRHESRAS